MLKRLLLFIFYLSLVFPGACSTDEISDDYSFENNGIMPDFAVADYPKVPVLDCNFDKLPVIDNGYYLNSTLSSTGVTSVPGIRKSAVNFGSGGKIVIKDNQSLNFGYGDFSFSLWIKTTNNYAVILEKRKKYGEQGYLLKLHNGALLLQVNDSATGFYNYFNSTDSVNIADGNWHHLAVSVDRDSSSGIKLYVDGYLSFEGNALYRTADTSNASDLQIGSSDISLDELKLYNRVISQEEITNLKRDPSCIAKYTFEETHADISGNGHPLNKGKLIPKGTSWYDYRNDYGNVAGVFRSYDWKLSMPSSKKILNNSSLSIAFNILTNDSYGKVIYQNTGGLKIDLVGGCPRVCIRSKDQDVYLTSKTRVDDGKWHHIVFSYHNYYDAYESGEYNPEAYIVVDNHVDDTYFITSRNSLYVGEDNIYIGGFTGSIDNLSFYDKEISLSDAISLYYSTAFVSIPFPGELNAYYGHLHNHSNLSDGIKTAEEAYKYARDIAKLDFFGLADHEKYMTPDEWITLKNAAIKYNSDNNFVAFSGFEWSEDNEGHVLIINTNEICYSYETATNTFPKLINWINSTSSALAFLNHPGDKNSTNKEFSHFTTTPSPKVVGMELWNKNAGFSKYFYNDGYYSNDNGIGFFDEANARGWKLGAAGSDDNHDGTWGSRNDYRLAVLSPFKTKASITESISKRRFYSTLDKNLKMWVEINGVPMGGDAAESTASKLIIRISDPDNEMFRHVTLYKNGIPKIIWQKEKNYIYIYEEISTKSGEYYYISVKQADGEEAISSPIYIY